MIRFFISVFAVVILLFSNSIRAAAVVNISMTYEPGPVPINSYLDAPWVPTGAGIHVGALDCQASALENSLLAANGQVNTQALHDFFTHCESSLAKYGANDLISLVTLNNAKYNFLENPNIREVKFTIAENYADGFQYNEIVRGIIATHPEGGVRPWLLIKCGLFCSVSNSSMFRNLLMSGFDESPFNLIILNGNTSEEYSLDNHRVSMGGFNEGRQTAEIANWLRRDSLFKGQISSLHLIGLSNGGQAALYAASYNKYMQLPNGHAPIDSIASLCPVVDLHASMRYVFETSQASSVLYQQLVSIIGKVYNSVPILPQLFNINQPPQTDAMLNIVATAAVDFDQTLPMAWSLQPFNGVRLSNLNDLWNYNNFATQTDTISTPTLVWAAQNDGIVNFDDNAKKLTQALAENPNPNLDMLVTENGNHCGFSLAYGWDVTTAALRTHILSHSPEFLKRRTINVKPISFNAPPLVEYERHISQTWVAQVGQPYFTLYYKVWLNGSINFDNMSCRSDPFDIPSACYENRAVQIPFSAIPIANLKIPTNETMAEVLTRWMNSSVTILDENKHKLSNSAGKPTYVQWASYQ